MAQINKPNTYFNTVLYTGTGTTQSITGVNFQPNFTWIKRRGSAEGHSLFDVVRGVQNRLVSNDNGPEATNSTFLTSFDSDGFSLGGSDTVNGVDNYASWNWLASNTTASNTQGSITSTVSANTTSGFSIVSWSGTGVNATIGHGLGTPPAMIIVKERNGSSSWITWHQKLSSYKHFLLLDTTGTQTDSFNNFQNVAPTNNVFSIGTEVGTNRSTGTYIAYCFAEKKGFSKFGSYIGNGSTDGTFIYTGFKPSFVMTKCTSTSSAYTNWGMFDSKRPGYNQIDKVLGADLTDSENGSTIGTQYMDFLSNGFKCRNNGSPHNISGASYIYMAFAENPLVGTNNIPATAR